MDETTSSSSPSPDPVVCYKLREIARLMREVIGTPEAGNLDENHAELISRFGEHYDHYLRRMHPASGHPGCQYGEEKPLNALLTPATKDGLYVDVGANHPREVSNTWPFYQHGWRGLLVEPLPSCWSALLYHRPGDWLWPTAASDSRGMAVLREMAGLSSIRKDWPMADQGEILVETYTLADILDHFPAVRDGCRLCSIDVEGHEKEVIEGIDFDRFHPEMFIVEYLTYAPGGRGQDVAWQWLPVLKRAGYVVVDKSPLNMILLSEHKIGEWEKVASWARLCDPEDLKKYESL